jgi:hypothetical protein
MDPERIPQTMSEYGAKGGMITDRETPKDSEKYLTYFQFVHHNPIQRDVDANTGLRSEKRQ